MSKADKKHYIMKLFLSYQYIGDGGFEDTGDFCETIIFENDDKKNEIFFEKIPSTFEESYDKNNEFDEKNHYYYLIDEIGADSVAAIINFNKKIKERNWRNTFHLLNKDEIKKIIEKNGIFSPRIFVEEVVDILIKKEEDKNKRVNF